jgi:superfamily I DNA/RNA helicase
LPTSGLGLHSIPGRTFELKANQSDPGALEPGIRLCTRKRIKGLEYRAVALSMPKREAEDREGVPMELRCEWYVAATRAREFLLVTRQDW